MSTSDWTDLENDTLVAGYFAMFVDHLSDRPFVKAEKHRELAGVLSGRTEKSIEYKLQNVSGALQALGYPRRQGYAPATNFQMSLADAVARGFDGPADWATRRHASMRGALRGSGEWFVGPSPTVSKRPSCGT